MKTRKFADGGDAMEEANKGEDLAAELRGENILMAMRDAAAKPKPKRRAAPNPTLGEAKDKNAQAAADAIDPGDKRTREIMKTRGSRPANYSRNTRTGATATMMQPRYPSKESVMERRTQYKQAQDESAPSTFRKGGSVSSRADGIAQRGRTRGKMC